MLYILVLVTTTLAQLRCKPRDMPTPTLAGSNSLNTPVVLPTIPKTKCGIKTTSTTTDASPEVATKRKCPPKIVTTDAGPDVATKRKCPPKTVDPVITTKRKCGVKTTTTATTTTTTIQLIPTTRPAASPQLTPPPAPKPVITYTPPKPAPVYQPPPVVTRPAQPAPQYVQEATPGIPANFQSCLDLHNQARAAVGVSPLTASASLSKTAEEYAQVLKQQNGNGPLNLVHSGTRYGNVGENLYANSGGVTCAGAMEDWVNKERPFYKVGTKIDGPNFESYGHYTQIVYRPATQVGCSSENGWYYVCHYDHIQNSNSAAF